MKSRDVRLCVAGLALAAAVAVAAAPQAPPPDVIVSPSSVGRVEFPHRAHVDDYGVDCVECHHETAAAPLTMPHPGYLEDYWLDCTICHRANAVSQPSQACSACHPERPVRVADQTVSSKVAIHRSCWRCHEPGTGAAASAGCDFCHQREAPERPRAASVR